MKILDRYIIGKFLGTFVFMLLILTAIVLVVDMSEKIDRINDNGSTISEALVQFYPYWLLWLVNTFIPVAVFVSVIYFTSRITNNTEVVAMQAGGVSFFRISRSYLMAALLIAVTVLLVNHFLLPISNIKKNKYEYTYLLSHSKKNEYNSQQPIAAQISDTSFVFVKAYNRNTLRGQGFIYQVFSDSGLTQSILSNNIAWNKEDSVFTMNQYYERIVGKEKDSLIYGPQKELKLDLTPDELLPEAYFAENMKSPELIKFIEKEKFKGSANANIYLLELYKRTSIAFTVIILTMLALSLSSKKVRGGLGLNLAVGIALAFIYIFIVESARIFTSKGLMPPFWAAWIGNFIFGGITLFFYVKSSQN